MTSLYIRAFHVLGYSVRFASTDSRPSVSRLRSLLHIEEASDFYIFLADAPATVAVTRTRGSFRHTRSNCTPLT